MALKDEYTDKLQTLTKCMRTSIICWAMKDGQAGLAKALACKSMTCEVCPPIQCEMRVWPDIQRGHVLSKINEHKGQGAARAGGPVLHG